ncbi:type II secretion system protein [Mesotoga sp.]|uniref:type II secretion system protein n=1 Tax=Mesotoga sp. TaxID=2053577 RepID=UPI00345EF473
MKNRKRGFSLVELLIVLAVIAALIATITPVALNAIKKAQATKVAQNLKTLASSFENAVYVNDEVPSFTELGRDIDSTKYAIYYTETNGTYSVAVVTSEEADGNTLTSVVADIQIGSFDHAAAGYTAMEGIGTIGTIQSYYTFTFDNY